MRRLTRPLCGAARLAAMTRSGRFLPSLGPRRPHRYDPGAHGPDVLARRRAVPRRGAATGWRRTCPAPRCRRATPGRASPPPRMGAHTVRCRATRWCQWPERIRRPRSQPVGMADLRRGVLRAPARRSASRRTASSCSRRRSSSSAHRRRRTASSPKMASGRADLVPGLVGAERGQRPRRHPEPGRT